MIDGAQLDEAFPQIAWRTTAPAWKFLETVSLQHRYDPESGTGRALCGLRPRWAHETPGDSRRCGRCDGIATARLVMRDAA